MRKTWIIALALILSSCVISAYNSDDVLTGRVVIDAYNTPVATVTSIPTVEPTPTREIAPVYVVVTASPCLRLRYPTQASPSVMCIPEGDVLEVLWVQGDFYYVLHIDTETPGYVAKAFTAVWTG